MRSITEYSLGKRGEASGIPRFRPILRGKYMILFYNPFLSCKFLQCRRHSGLQVPQDKSNTFLLIKGGLFLKIEEQDLCNAGDIAVHQRIQKLLLDA